MKYHIGGDLSNGITINIDNDEKIIGKSNRVVIFGNKNFQLSSLCLSSRAFDQVVGGLCLKENKHYASSVDIQ